MLRELSPKVQADVAAAVSAAAEAGKILNVYAEADLIRRANLAENIALEDIVDALIAGSADGPGCLIDPGEAMDALMGKPSN